MDCCEIGSSPPSCADTATPYCADTATPYCVWVCRTHCTSGRPSWIALWIRKPAGFTSYSVAMTGSPWWSTLTRLEAVISSNSMP